MTDRAFYDDLLPLAIVELEGLRQAKEPEIAGVEIESVEVVEDGEQGPHIAVLFRHPSRPECRFGWRWSWTDGPKPEEAKFAAGVLAVNLEEDILSEQYGLPEECAEDGVTWF